MHHHHIDYQLIGLLVTSNNSAAALGAGPRQQ